MSVLLQISDTHFGTERAPVVEALVALALAQRPDRVLLSGDITQRASRAEFRAARAFTDRLGVPVLAIPGNHDIPLFNLWLRLFRPYARQRAAFGDEMEPVYESPELLLQCVRTTRRYRHQNGEVSAAQIERVAQRLQAATPAQLRLVLVHQPVAVPRPEDVHDRLRGVAPALQRWAAAGADIAMGGHIHLPYVMPLPGLVRPMWAVQAGTAVSARVRNGVPNSVNLLRWGAGAPAGRCLVERWDFAAGSACFERATVTPLLPARASA